MEGYVTWNHPVLGEVKVRNDIAAQFKDDAQVNEFLLEKAVEDLKARGEDISALQTFTGQVAREITSTSRGIQERVTGERTTSYADDFTAELALRANPVAGWTGLITGAILDPVTFLNPFSKYGRLMQIAGGTAAGGVAGFLTPVREEFGESTAVTTGAGAALGGAVYALGPLAAKVVKKLGFKSTEEMQKAFSEADEETRVAMQEQLQTVVAEEQAALQRMGDRNRAAAEEQAVKDAEIQRINDIGKEEELARIRRIGDEMEAERLNKEAGLEAIKQVGKDAELERIRNVADEFRAEETQRIIDDVRKQTINDLETRIKSTFGGDPKKVQADVAKANNKLNYAQAELRRVAEGTKKVPQERVVQLEQRVRDMTEEVDFLRNKRDVYKQRQADVKELVQVKHKDVITPTMQKEIDARTSRFDAPPAFKAPQQPAMSRTPEPVVPQQVAPERPVVSPIETPTPRLQPQQAQVQPQPTQAIEQPTTLESLQQPKFTGQSVGAGQRNILTAPTSAADAANLDLRTREARNLPEPKPSSVASRPEMTDRQAKQQAYMQKADAGVDQNLFNVDDVEGNYTFKNLLDAAEDQQYFAEREIDAGNYKDAADWVAREFENSGKILSPATKIVAARIYAIASDNLVKLQEAFRDIEKTGRVSPKMIEMLGEMQEDAQLRNAMDVMRNIERIEEADKKNTSAALNAFKLANRMKKAQMQQLARARTISKLYFGVEC